MLQTTGATTTASEPWALLRNLWVIQISPTPGEATLLQAEHDGGSYVLCFTSDDKARALIAGLTVAHAWTARVPSGHAVELVSAVCQVGAIGIIVDFDPRTRRCAWSRRLVTALA
jgi:hypothetical protein